MAKTDIEYAESFAKLLRCPTITESGAEYFEKFQEVLKQEFPLVFEKAEHFYPGVEQGDKESRAMIFHIKGKKNDRPIVLMAHQDVVPVDGEWKYAPFSGEIADGKVWGRGAMDCKNTLFITISAIEELLEEGFVPEQDVYLTYSDNEETSGPGADYFVNYFKANDIHPAIAVDEGGAIMYEAFPGMDKPFAMVGVIEKGYCDLKFVARSKGGHSSSPPKNTPFARLAAFMDYCENNKVFDRKLTAPAVAMLKGMSSGLHGALGFVTKHAKAFAPIIVKVLPALSSFGRALTGTTMTFTMANGSNAANVIPQEAWVVANLRFAPGDKSADCIEKVKKIAEKYDIETEVLICREHSPLVDTNSAEYKYFCDTMKEIFPEIGVSPYLMFGGTDCRRMQTIVPCAIRCTPCFLTSEQLASMHAANENIDISSIVGGVKFFKKFVKDFK